ncbi:hypothetical protein [Archangium violaceum]|uniref:hypothetical protein n=1 Tax=Archangium violaceum TaxID=83451 RepID=UPI001EF0B2FE|nr:hypothetical protein [Archangium violaceum]
MRLFLLSDAGKPEREGVARLLVPELVRQQLVAVGVFTNAGTCRLSSTRCSTGVTSAGGVWRRGGGRS